ncbi:MAG: cation transporter dimerization domain-containing protein, partial [Nitriliruptorales bacterium]|nr:cation transporter dimerization domain-containing protein [Nitriliruptorales bacterium]
TVRHIVEVLCRSPKVKDHHTLRARRVGSRIYLDACIELDPDLSFAEAHDLSHDIKDQLYEEIDGLADAVIHFEPAGHPAHQDTEHHAHGFDALAVPDHEHDGGS